MKGSNGGNLQQHQRGQTQPRNMHHQQQQHFQHQQHLQQQRQQQHFQQQQQQALRMNTHNQQQQQHVHMQQQQHFQQPRQQQQLQQAPHMNTYQQQQYPQQHQHAPQQQQQQQHPMQHQQQQQQQQQQQMQQPQQMAEGQPGTSDRELLQQAQLQNGEKDGMLQILQRKLAAVEEENFELHASIATAQIEDEYENKKRVNELEKKLAAVASENHFLLNKQQNAERTVARMQREREAERQKEMVNQKRLEAKIRQLASKGRKQESAWIAASQTTRSQQSQQSPPPPPRRRVSVSTAATAVQTEPLPDVSSSSNNNSSGCAQENAELLAKLMATSSRDLLTLFNGTGVDPATAAAATATAPSADAGAPATLLSGSSPHTTSSATTQVLGFSQSVFSQLAGHAQAQAQASLLSFALETNLSLAAFATERARELYDTLALMLAGNATALALAPVVTKYLAAPTDLDADVLTSVLRVLYAVMHHSERFQRFLLVSSVSTSSATGVDSVDTNDAVTATRSTDAPATTGASLLQHPRVSLPGLQFASLDDFLAARTETTVLAEAPASAERAAELRDQRTALLHALCRVVRNYAHEPCVVEHGLIVLSFWVDLGVAAPTAQPDFTPLLTNNVIQDVVLAPKGAARTKRQALALLTQLLHFANVFPALEASARKSLLLNRCAQMLAMSTTVREVDTVSTSTAVDSVAATGSKATTTMLTAGTSQRDVQLLQLEIVHVLLAIVWAFPSTGVRFVLDATRGSADDADGGHRSAVFYLAQLLHRETFALRVTHGASDSTGSSAEHSLQVRLVRDAFTLLALLARFVDLSVELDGAEHEHALLAVFELLRTIRFDDGANDSVSKSATALKDTLF